MQKYKEKVFDNRHYIWNGRLWYDRKTHLIPTTAISARLNAMIACKHAAVREKKGQDVDVLMRRTRRALHQAPVSRALKLAYQVYRQRPQHIETAAILCTVLRKANKPGQAEALANNFIHTNYSPILLSRAAALCDLRRWDDALKQIRRIFAMNVKSKKSGSNGEALAVYSRIKQNAPSLFEEQG